MQKSTKPSITKQKKQATHEFFPRTKPQSSDSKKETFEFNKAPINRNEAYKETRTKVIADREEKDQDRLHSRKSTSFLSKLYQDDDEYDALKVHGLIDDEDDEVNEARNETANIAKRKTKAIEKSKAKTTKQAPRLIADQASKIGKLDLRKDTLAMFAVCEVSKDYLIVNHTRNTKGYVPLKGTEYKSENFKKGQLIVASINSEIGGANTGDIYNFKSGKAGLNRKVQLTLDPKQINKLLSAEKVTKNMVLSGKVESKEAKGYLINFGFRDSSKGFLKY